MIEAYLFSGSKGVYPFSEGQDKKRENVLD